MLRILFCLLISILSPASGYDGAATTLADEKLIVDLGRGADILVDPGGSLSIHEVASPPFSGRFVPSGADVPNLGYTGSAVWARIKVKNLTFAETWLLQAAYSDMDHVELYTGYTGEGSNWEVRELGQALPFSTREVVNRNLLFPLELSFGREHTFYLRYGNTTGMTLPLRLFSSKEYQTFSLGEQLASGVFFGFMLVLSIYNLILGAKLREAGYLYSALYGAGYGLFQFSLYGLSQQYLWPDSVWWAGHSVPFLLAFAFSCRILFTMSVLGSRENAPGAHKALKGLLASLAGLTAYHAMAVSGLLPASLIPGPGATLAVAAAYFAAFTAVTAKVNVACLRKRLPAARSIFTAWVFMATGLALYAAKSLGILPSNLVTEYGLLIGSVGEMCLLFVSLGENIRAIKSEAHERRLRQQAAIQAYQEEQIRSMRLELELVKANIQPHFMLNSINAVIMWIREDPGAAEKLLYALSRELKLLQGIVGEKVIPLGEEISLCRLHLEVMSLRHDKRFTLELEGIDAGETVPPMVFHTLVENGLTHGYARKESGVFVLSRSEAEGRVRYSLFNDGEPAGIPGRAGDAAGGGSGGLGLKYVRARLQEAYGRDWSLDSRAVEGGWRVDISIGSGSKGRAPADRADDRGDGAPRRRPRAEPVP